MKTEADVAEALKAIGYDGKFAEENSLKDVIVAGPKSEYFRELITWIAFELHALRKTEEKIAKGTDFNEFMLEMSGLLKEIGCPYNHFIAGPLSGRLHTRESRLLLLDYLITELMAAKMCFNLQPEESSYIIPVFETTTAKALVSLTKDLNLGKPPDNIAARSLFEKISNRLSETIKKTNSKRLSQPLFKPGVDLNEANWKKLAQLQKELEQEYNLRRQMLLTRLDVTVQSFQWSEKMKGREDDIINRYQKQKRELDQLQYGGAKTDIPAILAAREDLAIMEKTSSANVRKNTASKIQKHVIGKVPDRGGRAYEHAPPPPEMPSWQQNRSSGHQGGGRGGNRGGQGGHWQQGGQQRQNFNQQHSQYDQRQQFNQRQQFDSQGGFGNSGGGSNRVQGGWSQRGAQTDNYRSGSQYGNNQGGYQGGHNQGYGGSGSSGDRGGNRGRSNYNRGGSGGGWR